MASSEKSRKTLSTMAPIAGHRGSNRHARFTKLRDRGVAQPVVAELGP